MITTWCICSIWIQSDKTILDVFFELIFIYTTFCIYSKGTEVQG
jgi:hypothetical protein